MTVYTITLTMRQVLYEHSEYTLYNRAFTTQAGWPATLQKILERLFDDGGHVVILIFS